MQGFFSHWLSVCSAYVAATALLVTGYLTGALWPLIAAVAAFTLWDLLWANFDGVDRTAQETVESSTRARTYMSYFLAVYGAALAYFLLRVAESDQKKLLATLGTAGIPLWLVLLPFVLQAVSMLFFPIKLGGGEISEATKKGELASKYPTSANLAVLVITVWVEKVTTFTFVYVVILVAKTLIAPTSG